MRRPSTWVKVADSLGGSWGWPDAEPEGMYQKVRTVFFGTPEMAVPSLTALARTTEVVGVVCQPDRPAGRGLRMCAPPVKTAALELGLPVHQPVKVKTQN